MSAHIDALLVWPQVLRLLENEQVTTGHFAALESVARWPFLCPFLQCTSH